MQACIYRNTELRFGSLCNLGLSKKLRFSLQRHKSTRIRLMPNSWDSYAGFLWHRALVLLLLKKQANSTFCKVVKQKGEAFWHRNSPLLCKRLVPKLQNSAKPNSGDSLPVSSFAAFATGFCQKKQRFSLQRHKSSRIRRKPNSGTVRRFSPLKPAFFSGLWLGAFGRSRLYRCQSVPGPPMPCFVTQSFAFASGNSCFTNSRVQKHKNSACAEFLG